MSQLLDMPLEMLLMIFENITLEDKYNLYSTNEYLREVLLENVFHKQKSIGFEILMTDTCSENAREEVRWECSEKMHHAHSRDQIQYNQFQAIDCNQILIEILKLTPNLESLDLRARIIDEKLINTIINSCENLNCIHLNFSTIESQYAWHLVINSLAQKMKHIVIDNRFFGHQSSLIIDSKDFFRRAKILEELVIHIHPIGDLGPLAFDFESLRNMTKKLILFNAKVFPDSEDINEEFHVERVFIIERVLKYLAESEGKQLRYLRLNSSIDFQTIDPTFIWENFENLVHLSITALNYVPPSLPAPQEALQLNKLKYLTLNLDNPEISYNFSGILPNTRDLEELALINVVNEIEFLKISDGKVESFQILNQKYKNLKSLKLYNIQFKSFDSICNLKYLEVLKIEFEKNFEFTDHFTDKLMRELKIIVKNCKQMRKISIWDWSGFGTVQRDAFLRFLVHYRSIVFKHTIKELD